MAMNAQKHEGGTSASDNFTAINFLSIPNHCDDDAHHNMSLTNL